MGPAELVYGGVKYYKVRHAVMCRLCKETIESLYVHDYKLCACKSVGIDGGIKDGRLIGSLEHMENRSVYSAKVAGKTLWLPEHAIPQMESLAEKVNASE